MWLTAPLKLVRALAQALAVIRRRRPTLVVGLGGFVAGPGGIAAWLLRKPLLIHEQNAVAGFTNLLALGAAGAAGTERVPGQLRAAGSGASGRQSCSARDRRAGAAYAAFCRAPRTDPRAGAGRQSGRGALECHRAVCAVARCGAAPGLRGAASVGRTLARGCAASLRRSGGQRAAAALHRGHGRSLRLGRSGDLPCGCVDDLGARGCGPGRGAGAVSGRDRRSSDTQRGLPGCRGCRGDDARSTS